MKTFEFFQVFKNLKTSVFQTKFPAVATTTILHDHFVDTLA